MLAVYHTVFLNAFTEELIEDEELFPEDALSNHTDMVDNEPVINEAKRNFIRYWKYLNERQSKTQNLLMLPRL